MSRPEEVEIHVGHWEAENSGANGVLNEVREARRVGRRVYEILQKANVPSTYFEDNVSKNQSQNIGRLKAHHNADRNGLIVSIHFNASAEKRTSRAIGTEVLYIKEKALAERLALAISHATGGGLLNRGAKFRDNIGILTGTYEPAVLIEVCFVNSTTDAAIYNRDFEKICQSIARELASRIGHNLYPKAQTVHTGKVVEKEGDEMKFSSPALQAETEFSLASKAHREFIVRTAIANGANKEVWEGKLARNEVTEGDLAGLAIKSIVAINKGVNTDAETNG